AWRPRMGYPIRMVLRVAPLVLCLGLIGCSSDDEGDGRPTSADIAFGTYELTVETIVDLCMPRRSTGTHTGRVTYSDYGITIFVPEPRLEGEFLHPLEFTDTLHIAYGEPAKDCAAGGLSRELIVTEAVRGESFTMVLIEDWTNLINCADGGLSPIGNCHAERELHYRRTGNLPCTETTDCPPGHQCEGTAPNGMCIEG